MSCNAHQTSKFAFPGDHSTHGILHTSISSLNYRILLIGIGTDVFIEKFHERSRFWLEIFPIFRDLWIVFIKEMKRYSIGTWIGVMDIIWVGCPRKIMYIWR